MMKLKSQPDQTLNNEIILLRKSLKSIINQTKLSLIKRVKKDKERNKNTAKKESELLCLQNNKIKSSDVPLSLGLYPEKLLKIVTNNSSIEIDRVHARILLNRMIQKTLNELKSKYGIERVEKFLRSNESKVKKSAEKQLTKEIKVNSDNGKDKKKSEREVPSSTKRKAVKSDSHETERKKKIHENDKTEDPFFLDTNGSNYLAAVTLAQSSESSDSETEKPIVRKKPPMLQKSTKTIVKSKEPIVKMESPIEDIHPSWKAKQMKKVQIQEFKGTKIKFED